MADQPCYYLTTPIYYVNDVPHIGHAYTSLACDVLARFKRLQGCRVLFLTGTDEHGQKVEKAAETDGVPPQEFVDRMAAAFADLSGVMDFSNDDFIRTTQSRHKHAVQTLWKALEEAGEIYLDTYAGWYAVRDEAFYAENELIEGEGGRKAAPTGAEVEWVEEPSYFFRLSAWQDRLLEFYERNPEFIGPDTRRNEVVSFVRGGLRDLSVSRTTFRWGIPVPNNDDHIMYVWLDALTNYATAAGYPDKDSERFRDFWPADLHMVGKDIIRFHAVYWPAFLMAAGVDPPKRVFAHGWWTNEGKKISKSDGNVIDPLQLVDTYGLDPIRYFLMREVPFGNDGDFSHRAVVHRMNGDLANDLGNLCQRILSMIARNCDGAVPEPGPFTVEDEALMKSAADLPTEITRDIERQMFHTALTTIWRVVGDANRYTDAQAPWVLRKSNPERMATVLYTLAEAIRCIGLVVQPFMPASAAQILDLLTVEAGARDFDATETQLAPGTALPKPKPVFPRFAEDDAENGKSPEKDRKDNGI